MSLRHPRQVAS